MIARFDHGTNDEILQDLLFTEEELAADKAERRFHLRALKTKTEDDVCHLDADHVDALECCLDSLAKIPNLSKQSALRSKFFGANNNFSFSELILTR